jgi:hypothetical protein
MQDDGGVDQRRFRDPSTPALYQFAAHDIYVVCPRCQRRAVDTPRPGETGRILSWPRRLSCFACGHTAVWDASRAGSLWGRPIDPFFRVPLWLRAGCCGHTLWAFNERHLNLLEGYVGAKLRERGDGPDPETVVTRLPTWMKSAKHRGEILRVIGRLRASLEDDRPVTRG